MSSEVVNAPFRSHRFMCVRCGEILASREPGELAAQVRDHFTNSIQPGGKSVCRPVESRFKGMVIAFFDHGLRWTTYFFTRSGNSIGHAEMQLTSATPRLRSSAMPMA